MFILLLPGIVKCFTLCLSRIQFPAKFNKVLDLDKSEALKDARKTF